jgi:hypothetical protein
VSLAILDRECLETSPFIDLKNATSGTPTIPGASTVPAPAAIPGATTTPEAASIPSQASIADLADIPAKPLGMSGID